MIRLNLIHGVGFSSFPIRESNNRLGLAVVRGRVRKVSAGVLAYLAAAEDRTLDAWECDDLRVSWLTVLYCSDLQNFGYLTENAHLYGKRVGEIVWEYAFWMYYGKAFDKAQTAWAERRAQSERELLALPPKKPSASLPGQKKEAA